MAEIVTTSKEHHLVNNSSNQDLTSEVDDTPEANSATLNNEAKKVAISNDEDFLNSKLFTTRSGGVYVPPARLAALQKSVLTSDPSSPTHQRITWEALRKSLLGLINKVNTSNLPLVARGLFRENLLRGRGLLVKSLMRAQASAQPFTPVYATMVAIINSKLPIVGELLLTRLVLSFRRAYRRNDKHACVSLSTFLAHLLNAKVTHELLILQCLTLLLERPTADSVEIAVNMVRGCGATLAELSPKPLSAIFERFRAILHEGDIDKRVQYMIEVLFQQRKDKFQLIKAGVESEGDEVDDGASSSAIKAGNGMDMTTALSALLPSDEEQMTHCIELDQDDLDAQDELNMFQMDPEYAEREVEYSALRAEILGTEDEADLDHRHNDDDRLRQQSEPDNEPKDESLAHDEPKSAVTKESSEASSNTVDMTNAELINLRKSIYLTIMSSVDFEECGHKLLKLAIPQGSECELCTMIVECCSQERTYLKFYGLLAERFCRLNLIWQDGFERVFVDVYHTVHRLETTRIRNIAKLFGHLLETEVIRWSIFTPIRLTEEHTTSASRIFLKLLFQELAECYGSAKLAIILNTEPVNEFMQGILPKEIRDADSDTEDEDMGVSVADMRFAVNFFEAIGLPECASSVRDAMRRAVNANTITNTTHEQYSSSMKRNREL